MIVRLAARVRHFGRGAEDREPSTTTAHLQLAKQGRVSLLNAVIREARAH